LWLFSYRSLSEKQCIAHLKMHESEESSKAAVLKAGESEFDGKRLDGILALHSFRLP